MVELVETPMMPKELTFFFFLAVGTKPLNASVVSVTPTKLNKGEWNVLEFCLRHVQLTRAGNLIWFRFDRAWKQPGVCSTF